MNTVCEAFLSQSGAEAIPTTGEFAWFDARRPAAPCRLSPGFVCPCLLGPPRSVSAVCLRLHFPFVSSRPHFFPSYLTFISSFRVGPCCFSFSRRPRTVVVVFRALKVAGSVLCGPPFFLLTLIVQGVRIGRRKLGGNMTQENSACRQ